MTHDITIGPAARKLVDADGRASELPKQRAQAFRPRCTCGWRGQEWSTEGQAATDGRAHVRLAARKGA